MVSTSLIWLLSTWNVPTIAEELHLNFYFLLIDLELNSKKWLVATILDMQL